MHTAIAQRLLRIQIVQMRQCSQASHDSTEVERSFTVGEVPGSDPGNVVGTLSNFPKILFLIEDTSEL